MDKLIEKSNKSIGSIQQLIIEASEKTGGSKFGPSCALIFD